jgi:retinol dehydrogenase 12
VFKNPVYGAYTEIFAAFSSDVKLEDSGRYIIPWGRFGTIPDHVAAGMRPQDNGEPGLSSKFWNWCEGAVQGFL